MSGGLWLGLLCGGAWGAGERTWRQLVWGSRFRHGRLCDGGLLG